MPQTPMGSEVLYFFSSASPNGNKKSILVVGNKVGGFPALFLRVGTRVLLKS